MKSQNFVGRVPSLESFIFSWNYLYDKTVDTNSGLGYNQYMYIEYNLFVRDYSFEDVIFIISFLIRNILCVFSQGFKYPIVCK